MVNEQRLIEEFKKLTAMDSESYGEREMANYLVDKLERLGLAVEEDNAGEFLEALSERENDRAAGNIYGYLEGNAPGEPILFSAHMDTICPGIGKKAVFHEDGRITSEGDTVLGADDVCGIVPVLEMLAVIQEKNLPHPDIEVLISVAEEAYCQGTRVFDFSKIRARQAYVLDLGGPVGRAALAAPSILSFQIQIKGKNAHAGSCPERGIHAIAIAAKALAALPQGWVEDDTTFNIGVFIGGIARNVVPDLVELEGEIRSLTHRKALAWLVRMRETFEREAEAVGGEAVVSYREEIRSYRIREEEAVVQHFERACRQVGLSETNYITTYGGSDNNRLAEHGIRGLVMACGMWEIHTKNEYTTRAELIRCAEVTLALAVGNTQK